MLVINVHSFVCFNSSFPRSLAMMLPCSPPFPFLPLVVTHMSI